MAQEWTPSGPWLARLRTALNDAFDTPDFELLTSDYFHPNTFMRIAPPAPGVGFEFGLHQYLGWARMHDYLPDLVSAARERRPRHRGIADLAAELGLTVTGGSRLDNPNGRSLEAIIQERARFLNPGTLVERLGALEGQVCQLEIPGGGGTGFLVGEDLVLTNHHVVAPVSAGEARAADVRAVFDYRATPDGTPLAHKDPTTVRLAADWLVGSWPASPSDEQPGGPDAGPGEVDAALLRLAEPIGASPLRGGGPVAVRGWVDATVAPPPVAAGHQVFLLQHPRSDPLRLSIGQVAGFNAAGTRLRYDANSRPGSSGAPCFDVDLRLVALHHARDPKFPPAWNQAVPFDAVQRVLTEHGVALVPGP